MEQICRTDGVAKTAYCTRFLFYSHFPRASTTHPKLAGSLLVAGMQHVEASRRR